MGAVFDWSKTANSNDVADATVNWVEGQAPSTVNNSARAMMASVAKWRDDWAGTITTGGTSTAYTLTTNSTFTGVNGSVVAFIAHVANGASATLNVDGFGAKALTIDGTTALPTGSYNALGLYTATYNSSLAVWVVTNQYSGNTLFTSGTSMLFMQSAAPTGWVKQTSITNRFLRVVGSSTYNGTGGVVTFDTFAARTTTDGTVLTQGNLPNFNLNIGSLTVSGTNGSIGGTNTNIGTTNQYRASDGSGGAVSQTPSWSGSIGGTLPSGGSDTAHTHPIDCRLAYVDAIICNKS